ncbi:MAG: ABC-2 family transporter protein [Clostridia bacterium]|nr:ABC-2 family transporter protein [Clostridia bacterium]
MFMYTEAKKILRLFTRYFKLNLSSQMEYRASFLVQVFGMAINNATFIFFWWLAFGVAGEYIAGYTFKDIMFLWAVTSSAFGLAHILFYNVHRISNLIITGELDTFLLQPVPVLPNILGAGTSVSAWGDLVYGVVLLAIVWGLSAKVWIIFVLAVMLGAVIFTCVNILAHTLTFYIGNAEMIASTVFEFMISFSIYPDKIFSGIVRILIYSLLPAAFISHIPLRLVKDFNIGTLAIWLAFAIGFLVLSFVFFYRGLRKYESGNLIVTRM